MGDTASYHFKVTNLEQEISKFDSVLDHIQKLVSDASDFDPSWSPDGEKIAFESSRDCNREIYVMNADGTNPTRLTDNTAYGAQANWAPSASFATTRTRRRYYTTSPHCIRGPCS